MLTLTSRCFVAVIKSWTPFASISLPTKVMVFFLFFSGGLKQGKGEDGAVQFYFEFDENPDDDLSITQLKEFFTGLFVSYNLQKEVLIYV